MDCFYDPMSIYRQSIKKMLPEKIVHVLKSNIDYKLLKNKNEFEQINN